MAGYIGSKAVNLSTTGADINGDANIDGDLSFRDNDKAIFGAGSDLQIYHDGTHSYIDDASAGGWLFVRASELRLQDQGGTNTYLLANSGGAVSIRHANAEKLSTESGGVDITGTLTSDGLTVDGDAKISATSPTLRITETDTTDVNTRITAGSGNLYIQTENDAENSRTDRLRIEHSTGDISFYEDTGSTAKFFWDASAESLQLGGTANIQAQGSNVTTLGNNFVLDSGYKYLTSGAANMLQFDATGNTMFFKASSGTAGNAVSFSETMRIDSSGNLLVGKTSTGLQTTGHEFIAGGQTRHTRDGATVMFLNRETNDGNILEFYKDNSTVGSIGNDGSNMFIGKQSGLQFQGNDIISPNRSGVASDNTIDLGQSSARFDDIYATNGTIQTSDRNEKQDIAELTDAEQRVAVAAKGLLRKFRWRDAVAEKGDEARTHFGIIAQDLQAAFAAEGLDAGDYAMFISSTWTDENTGEERTRMGVRYSELLAFIIGAL